MLSNRLARVRLLATRKALVTVASSRDWRAVAVALAREGVHCASSARTRKPAETVAVAEQHSSVTSFQLDLVDDHDLATVR